MAGPQDEIRRIDQFATFAFHAFRTNTKIYMAMEDYCNHLGYNNHQKAEFLARVAYNTAEILQAESILRITSP